MVSKEGPGGGPREAIPGGVMGGRRACVLTKRSQGAVDEWRLESDESASNSWRYFATTDEPFALS